MAFINRNRVFNTKEREMMGTIGSFFPLDHIGLLIILHLNKSLFKISEFQIYDYILILFVIEKDGRHEIFWVCTPQLFERGNGHDSSKMFSIFGQFKCLECFFSVFHMLIQNLNVSCQVTSEKKSRISLLYMLSLKCQWSIRGSLGYVRYI